MDDLYTNAWSDPPDPELKPSLSAGSSWLSPKLASDEEADLATPSWSTGHEVHWNEPAEASGFSWSQAEPDLAWRSSTYEGIQIGKSTTEDEVPSSAVTQEAGGTTVVSVPQSPRTVPVKDVSSVPSPPTEEQILSSVLHSPELATLSPPADEDGFGTFESAISPDEDTALAIEQSDVNADAWGSAWTHPSEAAEETGQEPMDAWEAAQKVKAKQDRKVPPEVLASILSECEQFSRDAWPEHEEAGDVREDDRRSDWRGGLEDVEGLDSFLKDFLPPLTLQPRVQFGKTAIAKRMATSIRLTKNLSMTKGSPMSHYLAAKGSIAWEVAVKKREEVTEDDVPVGWRILEKGPSNDAAGDTSKTKKTSRIFSFWGRRDSGIVHSQTYSQTSSQAGSDGHVHSESSKSPILGDVTAHSRHPSQESAKSPASASVDKGASSVESTSSPTFPLPATSVPTSISHSPTMPLEMPSYADAPEPQVEQAEVSPAPPPSAVSRFLNRFSRRRSAISTSSHRNSIALSSDDLEFLSDIVPSASDDTYDNPTASLKALTSITKPVPLPPILPPPPSAPQRNVKPASRPSSAVPNQQSPVDSFDSFFDALDEAGTPSTGSDVSVAPLSGNALKLTMAVPVLQPSRPSTPTVLPLAGPSKRETRTASPSPLSVGSITQPTQPFYLPSPPSSRAQTPLSHASRATSQPPSAHPVSTLKQEQEERRGSLSSTGSRAPPPTFPPPRAVTTPTLSEPISQPTTPTSSLPLAQLYPNAYRARGASLTSAAPKAEPSFMFPPPPPPPTRSQTASLPPPLEPPPSVPSRKPSAFPLNVFDDDDFSDFLSSTTVPASSQPILAPVPAPSSCIQTPALLPPPPLSRSHSTAPVFASPPSLSLPSASRPKASVAISANSDPLDEDEFSDFHPSATSLHPHSALSFDSPAFHDFRSTSSTLLQSESAASTSSPAPDESFSTEKSFLTPGNVPGFDVTGVSPLLRTPSPPRPISKMPSHPPISSLALAEPQPQQATANPNARLGKAASHLHTLNLMERAAALPGRWPAPPSPLPPTLPGPGSGAEGLGHVDLMGDSPAKPESEGMSVSLSSPALMSHVRTASSATGLGIASVSGLPAPLAHSQSLQGSSFEALQRMATPPVQGRPAPAAPATTQNTPKSGGLSVQDLLFFEGL